MPLRREAHQGQGHCRRQWQASSRTAKSVPSDLKAGDKVLFGKYSGTEVKVDGEELLVMKEDDIMAVIEG
jgi:co-chaperonin GroES (HSP10)